MKSNKPPADAPSPGELLTPAEVAKQQKTSTKTVLRRIKAGKLPAIRDGRIIRVRPDDLRAYNAMRRTGGF